MKRRIILSIMLSLSIVLVLLTSSDSRVAAQNQIRIVADTGVVTLGPGQTLRVSVTSPRDAASGLPTGFRRIEYTQGACNSGVCKNEISSQTTSAPIPLAANESLQVDLDWSANVSGSRIVVLSNSRNAQVNVLIITTATGEVVAFQKHWEVIQ